MLALLVALVAARPGTAADPAPQVPAAVVQPLGEQTAAVVSYRELVGAADARRLNAAVVDTSSYWVAAVDRNGHVIAAQIPRPRAGRDFGSAAVPATKAPSASARPALPGAFDLAAALRDDGVAVLGPPGRRAPRARAAASCAS